MSKDNLSKLPEKTARRYSFFMPPLKQPGMDQKKFTSSKRANKDRRACKAICQHSRIMAWLRNFERYALPLLVGVQLRNRPPHLPTLSNHARADTRKARGALGSYPRREAWQRFPRASRARRSVNRHVARPKDQIRNTSRKMPRARHRVRRVVQIF